MTFYLLILPYFLVYHYFPNVSGRAQNSGLIGFCLGILVLQILGSIRAYYSWKDRDINPPKAPKLYSNAEDNLSKQEKKDAFNGKNRTLCNVLCCCFGASLYDKGAIEVKPPYRSKFILLSIGGLVLAASWFLWLLGWRSCQESRERAVLGQRGVRWAGPRDLTPRPGTGSWDWTCAATFRK